MPESIFHIELCNHDDSTKYWIDIAVGLSTILLAIMAIWGEQVKKFFTKAHLKYQINNKSPFIETKKSTDEDDSENSKVVIRLQVQNSSKRVARNCNAIISSYLRKRDNGDEYYEENIFPSSFAWHDDKQLYSINREIPSFLEIARITRNQIKGQDSSTDPGKGGNANDSKLILSIKDGEGKNIMLGKGCFIIPIRFYGDNIRSNGGLFGRSKPIYIKLYWNGSNISEISSEFTVSIISENDFKKEKKP